MLFWCSIWENINLDEFDYVPWEVIVKYKNLSNSKRSSSISSSAIESDFDNLEIQERLDINDNVVLMNITDDKSVEDVIWILEKDDRIEYVEPNYVRYLFYLDDFESNDTSKGEQWWLDYISWTWAFNAYSWKLSTSDVAVWVIDNGVNYYHSDLKNSMWTTGTCVISWENVECEHWYDFFHNTPTPLPNEHAHWTHVAWIIGAWVNNWTGIIWINPFAKIAALKVWRATSFTIAEEIKAINFAIENWIKIINASYWSPRFSEAEEDAIRRFWESGWLFVAAAGNDGYDLDYLESEYPCKHDLDNIICVAAINELGNLSYYSNYWIKSVDIAAPWSNIISTVVLGTKRSVIYSENFEKCGNASFSWWDNWSCYRWENYTNTKGYLFTGFIESPIMDLSGRNDVFLSFILSCYDSEVNLEYGDFLNSNNEDLWIIWSDWAAFNVSIWSQYYSDSFSFKLNSSSGCVIDDIEVYEDPYVVWDNDRYGIMSGTSMATPYVAWLASLVRGINPNLSYADIKNYILKFWDDNVDLSGKIISWKVINVKKTLDGVFNDMAPKWLISSWNGDIQWDKSEYASNYYYEVLDESWEVVKSGITSTTWVATELTWNYSWRVKWIDDSWDESVFSNSFICEMPELNNFEVYWHECTMLTWNLIVDDNCSDMYNLVRLDVYDEITWWSLYMDATWFVSRKVYVQNSFWEESTVVDVSYIWDDSLITTNSDVYEYETNITWSKAKVVWNVVDMFWVNDWDCGSNLITSELISCSVWSGSLSNNILTITAPNSQKGLWECSIEFKDDEWNVVNGIFKYNFDTVQVVHWWGWGWWWGGGGGWWSTSYNCKNLPIHATANNDKIPTKADTNYTYSTNTSKVCTFQCDSGYSRNETSSKCEKVEAQEGNATTTWKNSELQKPTMIELFEEDTNSHNFDFSWYNTSNPSNILSNWYSVEFNNAYEFAYRAWITTTKSIQEANLEGKLTRIAMAKMLSQYAINILGKEPDKTKKVQFNDVSSSLDKDYNNWVTLSYQLWIMWVWISDFRPNDYVTRWEFATALSRMLYGTVDWNPYYETHISKLLKEGIITNWDFRIKELRWYVMIMLMRSVRS